MPLGSTSAITTEGLLGLALASLAFAALPGPGVTAVVSQALARGFRPALLWGLGLVLGDLFYLLLAMLGLNWLAQQFGGVFLVLKWLGAAYLIFLGLRCLLARPQAAAPATAQAPARAFLGGFFVSLGNPKVIAFYCGFLPGFVHMATLSGLDMLCVAAVILPTVLAVLAGYAWLAARGRNLLRAGRVRTVATRGAGAAMIGAGAAVAAS